MTSITDHLRETARAWTTPRGAAAIALSLLLARLDGPAFAAAAAVAVPMCASVMTLGKDFRRYRATHDVLVSGRLEMSSLSFGTLAFTPPEPSTGLDDSVFYDKTQVYIRLLGGGYLRNHPITYLNPYSLYWYLRIRRLILRIEGGEDPRQIRRQERLSRIIG